MTDWGGRRRYSRVVFDAPAELIADHGCWTCRLRDISLDGVLLAPPPHWRGATQEFYLVYVALPEADISIRLAGQVRHISAHGVGLQCLSLSTDTQIHVQRLVAWNLGEPEILQRELAVLLAENGCIPH